MSPPQALKDFQVERVEYASVALGKAKAMRDVLKDAFENGKDLRHSARWVGVLRFVV